MRECRIYSRCMRPVCKNQQSHRSGNTIDQVTVEETTWVAIVQRRWLQNVFNSPFYRIWHTEARRAKAILGVTFDVKLFQWNMHCSALFHSTLAPTIACASTCIFVNHLPGGRMCVCVFWWMEQSEVLSRKAHAYTQMHVYILHAHSVHLAVKWPALRMYARE